MDKVMMWTIEGTQASHVQRIGGMDLEDRLEEILVKHPELLMPHLPHLILVGRQMGTGGGPLDLLGVDRRDGRLVVFELKKGPLSRDAIAQIIDYASSLEEMDLGTLVKHISDKSGARGIDEIDDFKKWYTENLGIEDLESLRPLRMFLVGLGADDTTERMVNFLSNRNVDISLLTFYGFTYEGKTLLVRQVHQEGNDDENSEPSRKHWVALNSRIEKYGLSDQFNVGIKMFRKNWRNPNEKIDELGLNFSFANKGGKKARLSVMKDGLKARLVVVFYSSAIKLCIDAFKLPIQEIPFQTFPPEAHEDNACEDLNAALKKYDNLEIQFRLKKTDWETHKKKLNELMCALYDAQQSKMQ